MSMSKIEQELRNKLGIMSQKMVNQEALMWKKDEEMFRIQSENQNLMADLKNLSSMEQAIRTDMMSMNQKRTQQEELIQQMKNKICQDALTLRHA